MGFEFGNDPAKTERYRKFWNREPVNRPLVGFTFLSWFPLDEFKASAAWPKHAPLTADMVHPEEFLDDWERHLREGEVLDDDLIRGVSPIQSVFWGCGSLGCGMRIMPGNVVAVPQSLPWDRVLGLGVAPDQPWFRKYLEFVDALVGRAAGRYPVSHGTLVGPMDYVVALRGHEQTVIDMIEEPENAARLMEEMGDMFVHFTEEAWKRIPRYLGGCYDAQYRIWSPGSIARMQEDAIAVLSPSLYREFVQPVDRKVASRFECPFMHLHATSMIVLEELLEVREIKAFEVNQDVGAPPVDWLIPYLRRIQEAGVPLVLRGDFTPEDARKLMGALDPAGLYVYIIVKSARETEPLRKIFGM